MGAPAFPAGAASAFPAEGARASPPSGASAPVRPRSALAWSPGQGVQGIPPGGDRHENASAGAASSAEAQHRVSVEKTLGAIAVPIRNRFREELDERWERPCREQKNVIREQTNLLDSRKPEVWEMRGVRFRCAGILGKGHWAARGPRFRYVGNLRWGREAVSDIHSRYSWGLQKVKEVCSKAHSRYATVEERAVHERVTQLLPYWGKTKDARHLLMSPWR